jgi:predicted RNase H-like HicB family nuclease
MERTYTAVFVDAGDGWIAAYAHDLPGANSQGRTIEEARENLKDAIRELLASQVDVPQGAVREDVTVTV